jgi:hypothetical protein
MTWGSDEGSVKVILPSGESFNRNSVSAADVKNWAEEAGVSKFDVKDSTGNLLGEDAFPVTSGTVKIEEYNEVKVYTVST